jgi:hypothetical protein
MRIVLFATAALLAVPASAATTLFSEDFDSITANTLQITTTAGSMDVTGAVDAVVSSNPFGITTASTVIDLDGSPGPGGVGKDGFNLLAGRTYTLSFVVGGAQRGSNQDDFTVGLTSTLFADLTLLSASGLFSGVGTPLVLGSDTEFSNLLAGNSPFALSSLTFRANNDTSFGFRIQSNSADNIGPLLDSVSLTQGVIPEPATWAMLIAGFGLVGTAMRRRRTLAAA